MLTPVPMSCLLTMVLIGCATLARAEDPPNIVMILADDFGIGPAKREPILALEYPNTQTPLQTLAAQEKVIHAPIPDVRRVNLSLLARPRDKRTR
jgi:hypothetical protein